LAVMSTEAQSETGKSAVGKEGEAWVPPRERLIVFENCCNFRQLGGYVTEDGKQRVMYGKLYRSAALHNMTDKDKATMKSRTGIEVIMDLRYAPERERKPDPVFEGVEGEGIPCISLEVPAADFSAVVDRGMKPSSGDMASDARNTVEVAKEVALRSYVLMPFKNASIGRMLAHMRAGRTLLWHCSAGKDRTGILAMVALAVLGIPLPTIVEDYMLTNEYSKNRFQEILDGFRPMMECLAGCTMEEDPNKVIAVVQQFVGVQAESIKGAYNAVISRYGNFEKYVQEEYGVSPLDVQIIRAQYLEPIE